ncbi:hypothetical protein D6D01_06301 [Aureobasidium pullulans]|uniref:Uncharacterized protein n=1 Tax=Aureobasidium pullulans TaxID=5580 RepID=A0A4S9L0J1_AURPU|nr:hypothetical protein D6D01_06301 [Aureobasidium pullulans]
MTLPKDYNCTEGKKPIACKCAIEKSKAKPTEDTPNNELTTVSLLTSFLPPDPFTHLALAQLKNTILHRNQNIEFYKSLYAEYIESIQEHITPYIRNQLKHEQQGRGLRKGSVFQMHLMMNLRIRVQSVMDTIARWEGENAVDEEKLKNMEKGENGVDEEEERRTKTYNCRFYGPLNANGHRER